MSCLSGPTKTELPFSNAHHRAPIDPYDKASLQRGAHSFVNYCLNCHSASYMRYNRLEDLGLTEQQIRDNLVFTGVMTGEFQAVSPCVIRFA